MTDKAIEIFGMKNVALMGYTNATISTQEEFEEDFAKFMMAKKLATRIYLGKTDSIRLLCNHIICITNVFDVTTVKHIFKDLCTAEISSIKTVMTYLNFLDTKEWADVKHCLRTAELLKEMDR